MKSGSTNEEIAKMINEAKDAIKNGDIAKLEQALDSTYTTVEYYTYMAPPEGNWTYELGIPDDVDHEGTREIKKLHIDKEESRPQLLLFATEVNQPEIVQLLIHKYGVEVTPVLMKQYLDLFKLALLPNLKKFELKGNTIREMQDKMFQSTYDVALIMFKNFLRNELRHGTVRSITNILTKVGDYLPKDSDEYKQFMLFSKVSILAYGNGMLIYHFDQQFKYSDDKDLLNNIKVWLDKESPHLLRSDPTKFAFFNEHLIDKEGVLKLDERLNLFIQDTITAIADINTTTQQRSNTLFYSKSRATDTQKLLTVINAINANTDISSANKIWEIASSITDTYNLIAEKVNNSLMQRKSTTATQLLSALQELCKGTGITVKLESNVDNRLKKIIKLEKTITMESRERMIDKFLSQEDKPSNKR